MLLPGSMRSTQAPPSRAPLTAGREGGVLPSQGDAGTTARSAYTAARRRKPRWIAREDPKL